MIENDKVQAYLGQVASNDFPTANKQNCSLKIAVRT